MAKASVSSKPVKKRYVLKKTCVVAAVFYTWDALISGLPAFGVLITLAGFIMHAVMGLWALLHKRWEAARLRAYGALIFLFTLEAIFATYSFNLELGKERAQNLISAVEQYHTKEGRYPDSLQALVPDYLANVPRCCFRMLASEFRYLRGGEERILMWVVTPPFDRISYSFERGEWRTMD